MPPRLQLKCACDLPEIGQDRGVAYGVQSAPANNMEKSTAHVETGSGTAAPRSTTPAKKREPAPVAKLARKAPQSASQLLLGAGIGAALVLSAMALANGKARRRARVVSALTRVALFGVARVIAGRNIRGIASSAVLEGAKVIQT